MSQLIREINDVHILDLYTRAKQVIVIALAVVYLLGLSACTFGQGQNMQATEPLPDYETYRFDDITVNVPANWCITREDGYIGQRAASFYDPSIEPRPWGQITVNTSVSVRVIKEEELW